MVFYNANLSKCVGINSSTGVITVYMIKKALKMIFYGLDILVFVFL